MTNQRNILVVDYDPSWPLTFAALRAPIWQALADIALSVEHVGSTSIPGLAAKPIIDIDAIIASRADMSAAVERLAALGYAHSGTLGIEGREAFESPAGPAHHLYVCVQGDIALANHLAIRDCLRRNPARALAYGQLKKQLARQFPADAESYVAGKTDFLVDVLRTAGFPDAALETIRESNRR
ncbi:MAG TPA: GrpB family protein [Steroidobacteraceae bacterium]|jgi:GrpB-like predicted nucleotidyltransferase (UPF0157 family)|nr:GrpB family protein [Steroidobacteraceae bacterium]